MTAVLEVKHLRAGYGQKVVLVDISFTVMPKEIRMILGASGCGKSTLLNNILKLERAISGTLSFFGCLSGMIVAYLVCEISPYNYIFSLKYGINLVLITKSMIKSLVFGWIIALVAAQKGLNVRGGADAVGKATTSCVVTSISGIIIADALFSFIYY